ncbi:MAG: septation protein A [Pigmentiphaga sp.]
MKKLLFDLFPLILFFVAYRVADIYTATAVAMVASVGQWVWLKVRGKAIELMHWINLVIILGFGGATLWLRSEVFIMWKPTVLYWLFGGAIAVGLLVFRRNLVRQLMSATGQIELPDAVWQRMAWMWATFFVVMGGLNLVVAFSGWFTESQWVSFKVFGTTILFVAFVIGVSLYMSRYLSHDPESPSSPTDSKP